MKNTSLFATVLITCLLAGVASAEDTPPPETAEQPTVPPLASDAEGRKTALKTSLLLQRLGSAENVTRKTVSSDLYGSGENIAPVLEAIAELVGTELQVLKPDDELQDEVAWHLKALGGSGQEKYRPLIEQGLKSVNSHVAGHAQTAARALDLTSKTGFPLLLRDKVRILNLAEAQSCVLVRQQEECSSMRGMDQCKSELGYQTMEAGGDAYLLVGRSGRGWTMRAHAKADLYLCHGNYTKDDGTF